MCTRTKIEHDQLKGELAAIDRVSELPWGILDNILGRLQMKEVVRTSILSRQWRYKWVNLSKLLFDVVSNRAVWNFPKPRCVKYHIFNVLLSHCGNIHTFKLCNTFPEKFSNLQTWICYLARNGIREFTLEYACAAIDFANLFKLPACIWSCEHLTHLQLRQYELPQPPCASKGRFRNLVGLNLYGKLNDMHLLENLTCNCPVLQILMLNGLQNLACLSIQAPKLKQVDLQGKLEAFILKSCSVLAEITLVITSDEFTSVEYQDEGRIYHLVHYLSQLSSLKRLKVSGFYLKNWLMRDVSDVAYTASNHLKLLYLIDICFNDRDQTKATFKLPKHFANLQELQIFIQSREYSRQSSKFLQAQNQSSYCFRQLQIVKIHPRDSVSILSNRCPESEFIKLLLNHSPILEKMVILNEEEHRDKFNLRFKKEILLFKRSSPEVKMTYCPVSSLPWYNKINR